MGLVFGWRATCSHSLQLSRIYIYFQQDDCYFLRNLDLLVHLILSQRQRQSFGPIALLHHYLRILRWRQRCDGGERDASNRQSSLCLSSRTLTGKKAESRRHNAIYSLIRGNVQVKNDGLSFSNANTNRYKNKTQTRRRESIETKWFNILIAKSSGIIDLSTLLNITKNSSNHPLLHIRSPLASGARQRCLIFRAKM